VWWVTRAIHFFFEKREVEPAGSGMIFRAGRGAHDIELGNFFAHFDARANVSPYSARGADTSLVLLVIWVASSQAIGLPACSFSLQEGRDTSFSFAPIFVKVTSEDSNAWLNFRADEYREELSGNADAKMLASRVSWTALGFSLDFRGIDEQSNVGAVRAHGADEIERG